MTGPEKLLLDTCVVLFAAGGEEILPAARMAIEEASEQGGLFLSPVSAWEIGLLMARGRLKSTMIAIDFFNEFVEGSGCIVSDITPAIFANSSSLPHFDNRDPADCLLVTTARAFDMTIVTRDRAILTYGNEGHVKTLPC
ncbi:MAG: type II toxin-antitoxin system VapC family toxin [Rhizobiales bacterium]|nr:type II toxin-antitoxin system VapC family toxin [Hyphomicrobiales bacterium]